MTIKTLNALVLAANILIFYSVHGKGLHTQPDWDYTNGRLPLTLQPYHYNLEIQPFIYEENPPFTFDGNVAIYFHCLESTDVIALNSQQLNIVNDSLQLTAIEDPAGAPNILDWNLVPSQEFFIIQLDGNMTVGEDYALGVSFSGIVSSQGVGLYWTTYRKANGETQYILGSMLHAHYARRVFPCFDEPAMKAGFHVVILRQPHMTALGNGALIRSDVRDENWIADNFATTPYMSTYLLAFLVMDFSYLESTSERGQISRVWARDDVLDAAEWANSVVAPITDWFTDYTGQNDPLNIINHIGMLNFGGAMENWGLIFYGESNLLYKDDWFNSDNLRSTGTIISHELAHFWWGNLVTYDWWDEAWLSEGSASYFEALALDATIGWNAKELIWERQVARALDADSQNRSLPVKPQIDTPDEAGRGFSSSSYFKGASILRMVEGVLGSNTFQRGIQHFLAAHSYSTVVSDDLWAAFTKQAAEDNITDIGGTPLDMKKKFDPWILQAGYPLLMVERDYESSTLTLTQSHFNPDGQIWPPSEYGYLWNIPVNIVSLENVDNPDSVHVWLNMEQSITVSEDVPEDDNAWILVNVGAKYFYRILYDDKNQDLLVSQLLEDHLKIPLESRSSLINDAFAMTRAGIQSEVSAFKTTQYLGAELEGLPWLKADEYFTLPIRLLRRFPETMPLFEIYLQNLINPIYDVLGWIKEDNEPIYQIKLREVAIRLACKYGNMDCVTSARLLFDNWKDNPQQPNPILADPRPTVYCTSIREGTEEDWQAVYDRYTTLRGPSHLPNVSVEIISLRDALSCSHDVNVLERYLLKIFDPDQIEPGHASAAMLSLARSDAGRGVVWNHLMQNWRNNTVPDRVSREAVLNAVVEGFSTIEDNLMFDEFWLLYPPQDSTEEQIYESSSTILYENREWADRNQEELHDWLAHTSDKVHRKSQPWI